jgi:hypothetical protein
MSKTSDFFSSRFCKAADFVDGPRTVVIDKVEIEEVGQGKDKEMKPVLYFEGDEKPLVLNKTNCLEIEVMYGDSDDWHGKPLELYGTRVPFGGKMVDAVRVRTPQAPDATDLLDDAPPAKPTRAKAAAKAKKPAADPDLDDVIPF